MLSDKKKPLIIILGPTATGKTKIGVALANKFNGEIISADSRQVYKELDIGSGKDLNEYILPNNTIPYHLIDIINPEEEFSLFDFVNNFNSAYNLILNNNNIPFLVGGTGLYIHSVLSNYNLKKVLFEDEKELPLKSVEELTNILLSLNPKLHNTTDLTDKERIIKAILIARENNNELISPVKDINPLIIGVFPERNEVKKRITERLKFRLKNGMIEEVDLLLKSGIKPERLFLLGLEYRYLSEYLTGKLNYNDMFQKLNYAIHTFAKKQMTWFRKIEKERFVINKFTNLEEAEIIIENYLLENFNVKR